MSLFSVFDPQLFLNNLPLNWLVIFITPVLLLPNYWQGYNSTVFVLLDFIFNKVFLEVKRRLLPLTIKHNVSVFLRLFFSIFMINYLGLMPYIFPSSGHLPLAFSLALPLWLGHIVYRWCLQPNFILAHLVPAGSPFALLPFMVIIESLRSLIRPIRLSVRLVANIVAGHLLITLLSSSVRSKTRLRLLRVVILGLVILRGLETAVALIQAYVFCVLSTIYIREVNTQSVALVNRFTYLDK